MGQCYTESNQRPVESNGTVKQRIIAHLLSYSGKVINAAPYSTLDRNVCQDGIAEAVGISRAHATLELTDLIEEGVVGERLAHVQGSHRRRRVYFII